MIKRIWAYLLLMRPANIVTAFADILAGVAIAGILSPASSFFSFPEPNAWADIGVLLLSTLGLYGGGVVFNDVFDLQLDKQERPERPLPSGAASVGWAIVLGTGLLMMGIAAAFMVNQLSGMLAMGIVVLVILYDAWSKHHRLFGPVNMGLCRAGNLLLGVSIIPLAVEQFWPLGVIPLLYIGAITLISQGEVHGGNRFFLQLAMGMYGIVGVLMIGMGAWADKPIYVGIPFVLLLAYLIYPALWQAVKSLAAPDVMKAVKAGVLALIVLDSALAAIFGGILWGLCVLALLPFSRFLAKTFAVT